MDMETASERELLEAHLEGNRAEVRRKVTGLDWDQATRRLGVSVTSAAGIVKHLTDVERWWFRHQLDGEEGVPFAWTDDEPDREFEFTSTDTLDVVLDEYDRACEESRAHAAPHGLDDPIVRSIRWMDGQRPTLRWVYLHMIEETARHNGHLDIYRELLDGTVDHD